MKGNERSGNNTKNNGTYWTMWGIRLFGRDIGQVLKEVTAVLSRNQKIYWIATVNTEFMMMSKKDAEFKGLLQRTDLNIIDGIGIIWAKKVMEGAGAFKTGIEVLQGRHKENLITGADLMDQLCRLAESENKSVYFYGGWEDRARKTTEYFLDKYPKLKVAGYQAEDFDFKTKADILFVARGMRKQEKWIDHHFDKLRVKIVMGVGRSFDYYSGELSRAPGWVRKMGLEWLFSLIMEPKRWRRQLVLPRFVWEILKEIE